MKQRDPACQTKREPGPGSALALARLLVDHALAAPLEVLVPPSWGARRLAEGLAELDTDRARQALEEVLRRTMEARRGVGDRPLREALPPGVATPLRTLARQAHVPRCAVMERLLDHPALREVLRAVLLDTLTLFAGRAGALLGDLSRLPGLERFSGIVGLARGLGGAVVEAVTRRLEGRAAPFVDEALGRAMQVGIEVFSDPRRAGAMAEWQASVVDAILDLPVSVLAGEAERVDLERVSRSLVELGQALGRWEEGPAWIEGILRAAGGPLWQRSLGEVLEAVGLPAEAWRPAMEVHLTQRIEALLAEQGVRAWIEARAGKGEGTG